jgi:predicted DNA-binding transcriptional regulator AlpA
MTHRHRRSWTPAEDAELRTLWASKSPQEIAITLNRTTMAIAKHAQRLKLPHKVGGHVSLEIPTDIAQTICDMRPKHTAREIADATGLSEPQIYRRVRKLGLPKYPNTGRCYEATYFKPMGKRQIGKNLHPYVRHIISVMDQRKISIRYIEEHAGVGAKTLWRWIAGLRDPRLQDIEAVLNVLGYKLPTQPEPKE